MAFLWCRLVALVWKKVVFLSPAFRQLFLLLWCHISSSMPSHLLSSNFVAWISPRSVPLSFMASSICSLFCRVATCFPTWPNVWTFQDFNDTWHFSKQASNGHCEWLDSPLSYASSTTLLQLSSSSHIDSNLNNLACRLCFLGWLFSLRTRILWSETEVDKWWSFTLGKTPAQSADTNALSNLSRTHPRLPNLLLQV